MTRVQSKLRALALAALLPLATVGALAQRPGDLDGNGRINYRDALLLAVHWYDPSADFPSADLAGGEGIREPDLMAFRRAFGQVYQPTQTFNIRDYVALQFGDEWHWRTTLVDQPMVAENAVPGPSLHDRDGRLRSTVSLRSDYLGLERCFGYRGNTLALFQVSVTPPDPPALDDVNITPEIDYGNDAVHVGDRFHTDSTAIVSVPNPLGPPRTETVYLSVDVTYVSAGEPVLVPAGRFLDTLELQIEATAETQDQTLTLTPISGFFWYARGVGEVRRLDGEGNLMELESAVVNGVGIP